MGAYSEGLDPVKFRRAGLARDTAAKARDATDNTRDANSHKRHTGTQHDNVRFPKINKSIKFYINKYIRGKRRAYITELLFAKPVGNVNPGGLEDRACGLDQGPFSRGEFGIETFRSLYLPVFRVQEELKFVVSPTENRLRVHPLSASTQCLHSHTCLQRQGPACPPRHLDT